jgi:hypothetical protein
MQAEAGRGQERSQAPVRRAGTERAEYLEARRGRGWNFADRRRTEHDLARRPLTLRKRASPERSIAPPSRGDADREHSRPNLQTCLDRAPLPDAS